MKRVKVIRFKAPLFFANATQLQEAVEEIVRLREDPTTGLTQLWTALVIDFGAVEWIDTSAIDVLREIITFLESRDIPLVCSFSLLCCALLDSALASSSLLYSESDAKLTRTFVAPSGIGTR